MYLVYFFSSMVSNCVYRLMVFYIPHDRPMRQVLLVNLGEA